MDTQEPRPVAAVITHWRKSSHADVLLSRILDPEAWGHDQPYKLKLAAVYADQFPALDLCRARCAAHGVPIYPTVKGAIGRGGRSVAVDGVLVIGEHGRYASNAAGQTLYPRRRLFEEVVHAFRLLGRRVPVFNDKHLSYDWLFSRWMYDLARHEEIPFLAGSSVPVAWRNPGLAYPMGVELTEALGLGYGPIEDYGFHALEGLQCMVERRKGGETGVEAVRCVTGRQVLEEREAGLWSKELLEALGPVRESAVGESRPLVPSSRDVLFMIRYRDGLKASVLLLASIGPCFAFAGRRVGKTTPEATAFLLEDKPPYGHFGHLLRAIEQMVLTGRSPYPVERTLLTGGMLTSLIQSRVEGGRWLATPHLAALRYQPSDWPHAPGPVGTPA